MAQRINTGSTRRRARSSMTSVMVMAGAIVVSAFILAHRDHGLDNQAEAKAMIVAEFDTVSVPVPVSAVPAGMKVKEISFHSVSFPKHQLPAGAITNIGPVLEAVTVAPLPANLPLFPQNVSLTAGSNNPVIERIPQGMRAMTIRVDATSSVEGWAGSGTLVDVLLIQKDRTTVVAEKVRVLSSERSVSPVEGTASPNVPTTVTLLVSQEQCLAINTAIPLGKIAFALRGAQDKDSWSTTDYSSERLKGGSRGSGVKTSINGYISIGDDKEKRSFALADGKWVATDVAPEGFLVSSNK